MQSRVVMTQIAPRYTTQAHIKYRYYGTRQMSNIRKGLSPVSNLASSRSAVNDIYWLIVIFNGNICQIDPINFIKFCINFVCLIGWYYALLMADVLPYVLFVTDVKSLFKTWQMLYWCRLMLCLLWYWTDVMSIGWCYCQIEWS